MQINISGHHVKLTDPIRDYCHSKLEKLSRHYDNITNAQVILSVEKLTQKAEARVQRAEARVHMNGHDLCATSEDKDLYAAIDALSDKLDRQLKKHKEKLQNHR
ncbi:ribosome hibernation-promoting factor, HPF/YfiA family [Microbulbifer rhizosphaerae]|uniref:Ribosome hibernation promoting factor n=1 Tax=Microbulbifer rhizosphaerae TaxID=1562603 RepID=A0A7W4W8X5_9GAMM|nr:ribosome-associated translation inhibitor RaiA [Microbulbifer rhizosphaerae]MBB3059362.1 putative sigma-54 modulation protein [Microbulbifer rhizosphaerae]